MHANPLGISPLQGIIMCFAIATAFALLCVTVATRSRLVRVLAFLGFAIELVCSASLLLVFLAHGVNP